MSKTQNTSLEAFNDMDEDDHTKPKTFPDVFSNISRYETIVQLNGQSEGYHVGGPTGNGSESYRLFHDPQNPDQTGEAGELTLYNQYDEKPQLVFDPNDPDKDQIEIIRIKVKEDPRTAELTEYSGEIKTALTDMDWVTDENPRGGWDEWGKAKRRLTEFYLEHYDNPPFDIAGRILNDGAALFAIARYPIFEGVDILSNIEITLERLDDRDKYLSRSSTRASHLTDYDKDREKVNPRRVNSPFAIRELLLDYYDHHTNSEN